MLENFGNKINMSGIIWRMAYKYKGLNNGILLKSWSERVKSKKGKRAYER
jgi:hypothetical protein